MADRFQSRPERLADERRAAAALAASIPQETLNPVFPYRAIPFRASTFRARPFWIVRSESQSS